MQVFILFEGIQRRNTNLFEIFLRQHPCQWKKVFVAQMTALHREVKTAILSWNSPMHSSCDGDSSCPTGQSHWKLPSVFTQVPPLHSKGLRSHSSISEKKPGKESIKSLLRSNKGKSNSQCLEVTKSGGHK